MAKAKKKENTQSAWQPIDTAPTDRPVHLWLSHVYVRPPKQGNFGEIHKQAIYHANTWSGYDGENMWDIETPFKGGCKVATHWMEVSEIDPPKGEQFSESPPGCDDRDDFFPF